MNCSKCGGRIAPRLVRICACEATPPTIVENVPALVCSLCGDQELSDQTVQVLERMRDGSVASRPVLARVFDFAHTRQPRVINGGLSNVVIGPGTVDSSGLTGAVGTHDDPVYRPVYA